MAFAEVGQSGYDTHADNFEGHKSLVPPMGHAWVALLDDLEDRGLLALVWRWRTVEHNGVDRREI
ncbi:DUF1501 domain-containing protein [Thalassoroseus pseudoceratinae]|uniref:DUF1501 domain-containing protein n=1 Tax=Thalassoroseus pseudoceratinae TaxID=2713176 RepID=UPI001422575D|nr:DUF1501 domain-containing protein [Thalassoroseus pseudoceratinae]